MAPCATSSRLVAGWLQHSCRRLEIQDDPFRHICFRRKLIRPGSDDLRLQPLLASSSMQVERTPPSNSSIDVFTGVCSRDSEHQGVRSPISKPTRPAIPIYTRVPGHALPLLPR
jgi:hypothetical protein